jgi:hypothetical protein
MALSFVNYTATSGQTEFAFSFPYLSTDHVKVQINGVDTAAYTVVTSPSTKIVLTSGATAGANVKVYRKTPGRSASPDNVNLVDFVNGSVLSEEDLDKSNKQLLYLVQESDDTGSGALGPTFDDTAWDATNLQIKNLSQPTAGTDAATKGYVDGLSLYGSAVVTPQVWTFTTAAQTDYTLSPAALTTDANMFILDIGGVPQRPTTNFTVINNGATLRLVTTPAAGVSACLRNFGATRNVQSYAAPVTFNAATTTNANATVNGTLTATNLTSVGYASLDGIWISNANSDSTSVYVGEQGAAQTGSNQGNTAVGRFALDSTTTGDSNAAFGYNALSGNTTGAGNSAFGRGNMVALTSGSYNTAVGFAALNATATASGVSALGTNAGRYAANGSTETTNLTNSVFVGNQAFPLAATSTNEIVIGANAVGAGSNTSTIGNSSTTDAKIYGNLTTTGNLNVQGIGTTTISGPIDALQSLNVAGNITGSVGALASALLPSGAVLQVVFRTTTDNTAHSTTFTNTGIYASITPKRSTSKIIMFAGVNSYIQGSDMRASYRFAKDTGGGPTAVANSEHNYANYSTNNVSEVTNVIVASEDSPATTAALTYVVQARHIAGGASVNNVNIGSSPAGRSFIVLVEVAA